MTARRTVAKPCLGWLAAFLPGVFLLASLPLLAAEHTVVQAERSSIVEMRVAALIMSEQQGGVLPLAIATLPHLMDPTQTVVLAEVDGAALLAAVLDQQASGPQSVAVFAYVLGEQLDVVAQRSLEFELDPGEPSSVVAAAGLKVFLPLAVPPGDYTLRVLVRAGEAFGLRGRRLVMNPAEDSSTGNGIAGDGIAGGGIAGDGIAGGGGARGSGAGGGGDSELKILAPIFLESDEPRLVVMPASEPITLPPPFGVGASARLPTSRPVVTEASGLVGNVLIAGRQPADSRLLALWRKPGSEAREIPMTIDERAAPGPEGVETVKVSFAESDLEVGLHEVAFALASNKESSASLKQAPEAFAISAYVPVFVEPGSPALSEEAKATPVERTVSEPLHKKQKQRLRTISSEYLEVLRRLAAGDREAAVASLYASETRVVEALDAMGVAVLEQAQAGTFESLDDVQWASLLPVALLHLEIGKRYGDERRYILSTHSMQRVTSLAESYAAKVETPTARQEAAQLLSSLASGFQLKGSSSQAERFYRRALELAGDDSAALLGLATLREKRGDFAGAVPILEGLVAVRPADLEGQLRLALNRSRIGRVVTARSGLRDLTTRSDSGWVGLVAHQELARLELDRDQAAKAVSVLRRGLERWPQHPTLTLQLAYALEMQGEIDAARILLTSLETKVGSREADERSRYNRWPKETLEAYQRDLLDLAMGRLDALASWLASLPEEDPG